MAEEKETNYTQGYSKATVASHASRTVDSDAGFLKPYIEPSDRILDVGCGPGTITVGFNALVDGAEGGCVTAVDISDEILAQARETAAAASAAANTNEAGGSSTGGNTNNTAIDFRKADILKGLPFPNATFTVVYASQLFPHLARPVQRCRALAEMCRVLKPGGILATRDAAELHFYPRRHDLDRLWAGNMARALQYDGGGGNEEACFPGGDMPALFRSVGFGRRDGRISGGGPRSNKLVVGAGTTVHSGPETRKWFAESLMGRLQPGDAFRESWSSVGITDEELAQTCEALGRWAEDEGGWYVAVQAEILAWK